eukprot:scaffold1062_cov119-Isochrysis_galbana.AAC.1
MGRGRGSDRTAMDRGCPAESPLCLHHPRAGIATLHAVSAVVVGGGDARAARHTAQPGAASHSATAAYHSQTATTCTRHTLHF